MFAVRSTEGGNCDRIGLDVAEWFESASGAVCTKLKMLQDAVVRCCMNSNGAYYGM